MDYRFLELVPLNLIQNQAHNVEKIHVRLFEGMVIGDEDFEGHGMLLRSKTWQFFGNLSGLICNR
jgi:hypothetical protein